MRVIAVLGTDQEDPNSPNAGGAPSPGGDVITSTGGNTSGSSGFIGGGAGQGATTTAGPVSAGNTAAPTHSGNYTNLSQYLQANSGGAKTTGQGVENVLNQSANNAADFQGKYNQAAQNDIKAGGQNLDINQNTLNAISGGTQNVNQSYLNQINQGTAKFDPNLEAKINAAGVGADANTLAAIAKGGSSTVYSGPTPVALSYGGPSPQAGYSGPSAIDNVYYKGPNAGAAENASYNGPQDYSSFTGNTSDLQQSAIRAGQSAAGQAKDANSGFSGLSALLKTAYQQPQYTRGENSLDAFLVGGNADAQAAVASGAGRAANASQGYDQINTALGNQIGASQQKAASTNAAYQQAIDRATATSNATNQTYQDAIKNAITSSNAVAGKYGADLAASQQKIKDTNATYAAAVKKATEQSALNKTSADAAAAQAAQSAAVRAQSAADYQNLLATLNHPPPNEDKGSYVEQLQDATARAPANIISGVGAAGQNVINTITGKKRLFS